VSDDEVMVRTLLGDWANRGWGMWGPGMTYGPKMLDDLVRLVRAEREACAREAHARVIGPAPSSASYDVDCGRAEAAREIEAAIRARAEP
jgi:L-amino acid N-acyltransferase YncA